MSEKKKQRNLRSFHHRGCIGLSAKSGLKSELELNHNSSSLVDGEKRLEGELAADREKLRRLEEKNAKLRDDLEKEQRDKSNLEAKMNSFLSSFKLDPFRLLLDSCFRFPIHSSIIHPLKDPCKCNQL